MAEPTNRRDWSEVSARVETRNPQQCEKESKRRPWGHGADARRAARVRFRWRPKAGAMTDNLRVIASLGSGADPALTTVDMLQRMYAIGGGTGLCRTEQRIRMPLAHWAAEHVLDLTAFRDATHPRVFCDIEIATTWATLMQELSPHVPNSIAPSIFEQPADAGLLEFPPPAHRMTSKRCKSLFSQKGRASLTQ